MNTIDSNCTKLMAKSNCENSVNFVSFYVEDFCDYVNRYMLMKNNVKFQGIIYSLENDIIVADSRMTVLCRDRHLIAPRRDSRIVSGSMSFGLMALT